MFGAPMLRKYATPGEMPERKMREILIPLSHNLSRAGLYDTTLIFVSHKAFFSR